MELATKVAELQFRNRDFVLMFRGQAGDYQNKSGYTSLKPSLLRASVPNKVPKDATISERFDKLVEAEKALVAQYDAKKFSGRDRLKRQRILRWAILQHYEICDTPLLDVTQSLRIAASFATQHANGEAFIFVLGIPHISARSPRVLKLESRSFASPACVLLRPCALIFKRAICLASTQSLPAPSKSFCTNTPRWISAES
ncbi:hypothetical protein CTI14_22555 [Methylobacterium radiotolerans]|nr:hypothetical protein CTI14_22555 [Methylobacterium radiotolerans]